MLVHQVLRDEPADVALDAERAAHRDLAALVDVLRVLVGVLPVLEHRVDLAVGHRLEDRDLRDLRDVDLAAELVLEHGLGDVGVGRRAGPGLLVQRHVAAVLAAACAAVSSFFSPHAPTPSASASASTTMPRTLNRSPM